MDIPGTTHSTSLLLYTLLAVVGLVLLIAHFKVNAFVSLIIASLFVGLGAGMKLPDVVKAVGEGIGAVLSNVAAIVGLGTILGKMLAESGGAEVVANTLIRSLGIKRIHWTMMIVGFIVGIPVWFTVGVVLLVPIVYTIVRETRLPLMHLGLPLVAGLSVAHGLIPPHPGPMVAIELLKADAGKTIFYSLIIGFPTAIIAGPIFARWIVPRVPVELGAMATQMTPRTDRKNLPGFALTLVTILLPVLLMLVATGADVTLPKDDRARQWIDFLGSPLVAMLLAVLFAFYSFGYARGFNKQQILKFSEDCLGPVATVLLVVGAGGGFNKVLVYSGVDVAIGGYVKDAPISPLILGWLAAALIRVATGSATVAISTATGIMAPILVKMPGIEKELMVVTMGAGSLILSHLNDGGFWFVKEYFGLTVPQTLKMWMTLETIVAIVALVFALLLNQILYGFAQFHN